MEVKGGGVVSVVNLYADEMGNPSPFVAINNCRLQLEARPL
jgi:hypothetical protein